MGYRLVMARSRLAAVVGGKALAQADARTLWQRFSSYMETHQNDFAGFARVEGFAHATVAAISGVATLTLSNEPPAEAGKTGPNAKKKRG